MKKKGRFSAHRTPDMMFEYAENCQRPGPRSDYCWAGGAAHLPGMIAAKTNASCNWGTHSIEGFKWLRFIIVNRAKCLGGVPVATVAIGKAGAQNVRAFSCTNSIYK